MRRSLVDTKGIRKSAVVIARVSNTADDRDGDSLNAESTVEAVNGTDQACRIAGCQLQVILSDTFFIVCVAMDSRMIGCCSSESVSPVVVKRRPIAAAISPE